MATMSGAFPEGFTPSLDLFLTPTFRGYLANYGAVLYPELHDVFYNEEFLNRAKAYWSAEYAKPELMLFNINGPCANRDPGHLDSPSFRGVRHENAPTWLCSVMGKSGLFQDYLIKMAQVITWFSTMRAAASPTGRTALSRRRNDCCRPCTTVVWWCRTR